MHVMWIQDNFVTENPPFLNHTFGNLNSGEKRWRFRVVIAEAELETWPVDWEIKGHEFVGFFGSGRVTGMWMQKPVNMASWSLTVTNYLAITMVDFTLVDTSVRQLLDQGLWHVARVYRLTHMYRFIFLDISQSYKKLNLQHFSVWTPLLPLVKVS